MNEAELTEFKEKLDENIKKASDPRNQYVEIYRKKLEETLKLLKKSQVENIELREKLSEVQMLVDGPIVTPKWALPARGCKQESHNIPVLLVSDLHYGENVNPEEMPDGNCYSPKVAELRWEKLIENTILKTRTKGKRPQGIVVCFLGDDISGDIHDELRETNFKTPIDSCVDVVELKTKMLKSFEAEYGKVWTVSVMGNHGRTTKKPRSKSNNELNYDSLIAGMLEKQFKNKRNFAFSTPKSGEAFCEINGHNFLALHGDRIGSRGGQGFIGPSATIARGQHKTLSAYSKIDKEIEWMLIGHFHVPMMLEHVIANGTLVGYSQYAKDLKLEPAYPSQTLFYVDETYGMTDYSRIYVTDSEQLKKEQQLYRIHPVTISMHVNKPFVVKLAKDKQRKR